MSITKNVHVNWYSSMEKNEKDSGEIDFKVFWHYTNSQNLIISFGYVDF